MRATIESTSEIATVNGVPARVWKGRTERGVEFVAYIVQIHVPEREGIGPAFRAQDISEFERELKETPGTRLTVGGYDLVGPIDIRMVL